jgi:DNA-binding CsgD family transcriptional regulator
VVILVEGVLKVDATVILKENDAKRLTLRLPMLICFAMFTAWQIGVFSYSGAALAVKGRLPLGIDEGNFTPLIIVGYLISIAIMVALPKRIVWAERITASIALASAAALYLPAPHEVRTIVYLLQLFCCCVMIGFETALIVGLFSERTALLHLLVAYGLIFALAGFMQNQFFDVPYAAFQHFNVIAIVLQLIFYFRLPSRMWTDYVTRRGRDQNVLSCPTRLFAGLFILCFLGNILISFGLSVAEGVTNGVFIFDCSFAAFAVIGYALLRRVGIAPLRVASAAVVVSVVGFILAIVSLYIPALAPIACVLLGPGTIPNILIPYYGVVMTRLYPSRLVAPAVIGISLVSSVILLSWMIELFRDNTSLLYVFYIAIAVTMAIIFLMLEPFLLHSAKGRPLLQNDQPAEDKISADKVIGNGSGALVEANSRELTGRERQVAQALMYGYDYKQIAARLSISPNTVATHRKRIYDKLEVHNVPELIMKLARTAEAEPE